MSTSRITKIFSLSLVQNINLVVSIITTMIFARLLTKQDLATYKQTFLAYEFLVPLLTLGLPEALFYFLPQNKRHERHLVLDNMLLLFIMGIFFFLFLLFGGTNVISLRFNNPELNKTLKYLIFYPILSFPIMSISSILLVKEKVKLLSIWNILSNILLTVSLLVVCLITKNYIFLVYIRILFAFFFLVSICIILNCILSKTLVKYKPDLISMKEMLLYAIPLGLSTLLGQLSIQLDKVIVSIMTTPEQFISYANGAIQIPIIGTITGAISSIIIVDFVKYHKENNNIAIIDLFHNAARKSAIIIFPAMIFLLFWGDIFIICLYSDKYIESILPFRLYLLILPIRIVQYGPVLMAIGKSKNIFYRSIGDLLINLVLSVLLVYFIGMMGAVIATIITLYLWTVPYNMRVISKNINISFWNVLPFKTLLKKFILSLICILPTIPFRKIIIINNNFLLLFISFFIYCSFIIFIFYIFDSDFKQLSFSIYSKLKSKI